MSRAAGLNAPAGSADPAGSGAGDAVVQAAYLQAVIRVYGPWTRSKVISTRERDLAVRRVRYAAQALADLGVRLPRTESGAWTRAVQGA